MSTQLDLCQSCEQKTTACTSDNNNIWDFNPYIYSTFYEMTNGFREFYNEHNEHNENENNENHSFYDTYNQDGYTYTQWYAYYISKNYYRFKTLKQQTYWFFQIMAGYGFFKKLVRLGTREDPLHTTLHHLLKYTDNTSWHINKMIELLHYNGLELEEEDGEGMSGHDYLSQHVLSPEDLEYSKSITRDYKMLEENLYKNPLFSDFKRCQRCNDFLNKYQQIIEHKDNMKQIKPLFIEIINKRQECINIYLKYPTCENSTKRHQYIVDLLYIAITDN